MDRCSTVLLLSHNTKERYMRNAKEMLRSGAYFVGAYLSTVLIWMLVLIPFVKPEDVADLFSKTFVHCLALAVPVAIILTACRRVPIPNFVSAFITAILVGLIFGFWMTLLQASSNGFSRAIINYIVLFYPTLFIAYIASWVGVLSAYIVSGPEDRYW